MGRKQATADYVNIYKFDFTDRYNISSKNEMFNNEDLIIVFTDDYIKFSVPTIDYNGKTHKVYKSNHRAWRLIAIRNREMPVGKFYFDEEESNEDELILYFEDGE